MLCGWRQCSTAQHSRNSTEPLPCRVQQLLQPLTLGVHCVRYNIQTPRTFCGTQHISQTQQEDALHRSYEAGAAPADRPVQQEQQDVTQHRAGKQSSPVEDASKVLRALCHYAPMELSDGPASLSKVRPYNTTEVQAALQYAIATQKLPSLDLQQLANIAGALAAAGHLDSTFMQELAFAAAAKIKAQPQVVDQAGGLRAFRTLCWLAVGFSRLGVMHLELMEQIAVFGTHLLQRCSLVLSKRKHGQQLALTAAAFAALKLHPPQLYRAIGEQIKQHRHVVKLLDPQESMLLLWAFLYVGHKDPPAELAITQHAATQVGQLNCAGLAHSYSLCASVGVTSGPLLSALRKATRVKLRSFEPVELVTIMSSLVALGQQDLLYLDELSRVVHNKLVNFTAAEICTTLAALVALRYRNTWLLDQASKMLVSRKLRKAYELTPEQLASTLTSLQQLGYVNPLLLGHLGSVAVEVHLSSCTPVQLAGVVAGYRQLGFFEPQLLLAAATRLLQLVAHATNSQLSAAGGAAGQQQQQQHACVEGDVSAAPGSLGDDMQQGQEQGQEPAQWREQEIEQQQGSQCDWLVATAQHLAAMPSPAGSSAEQAALPAALLGLVALNLCTQPQQQEQSDTMQQQPGRQHQEGRQQSGPHTTANDPTRVYSNRSSAGCVGGDSGGPVSSIQSLLALQSAVLLCTSLQHAISTSAAGSTAADTSAAPAAAAAGGPGSKALLQGQAHLAIVQQQLLSGQQQLHLAVGQALAATVAGAADASAAAAEVVCGVPGLLHHMQLLWLTHSLRQQRQEGTQGLLPAGTVSSQGGGPGFPGPQDWTLGLSESAAAAFVQRQQQLMRKQQQQSEGRPPVLDGVAAAVMRCLQASAPGPLDQQQLRAQVQVMYCVPSSPILLPVAVLPAAMPARSAGPGGPTSMLSGLAGPPQPLEPVTLGQSDPHSSEQDQTGQQEQLLQARQQQQQQQGPGQHEDPEAQQQQQEAATPTFLCVAINLQQRRLRLPAEAQELLAAGQRSGRPVAVFLQRQLSTLAATQPTGLPGGTAPATAAAQQHGLMEWYTRNAPQQLLPAALVRQRGLRAAGWHVLILLEEVPDSNDEE